MMRYKQLIGRTLRARSLPAQKVEAVVGCEVMNIMTSLGMPATRKLACNASWLGPGRLVLGAILHPQFPFIVSLPSCAPMSTDRGDPA